MPHSTKSGLKPAPRERIVVDTGVVVSAAFGGVPLKALDAAREELARMMVLGAEWVEPKVRVDLCRDPNDPMFLEASLAGKATVLLSGDKDLTSLKAGSWKRTAWATCAS